jgi:hypothetical protein
MLRSPSLKQASKPNGIPGEAKLQRSGGNSTRPNFHSRSMLGPSPKGELHQKCFASFT